MNTIIFIGLGLIFYSGHSFAKGSQAPKVEEKSSCEREGFLKADPDDKLSEYRSVFLPPASQYGGNANSGQVATGGKIACTKGHLCYLNQNYGYRLSTAWDKNKGCSGGKTKDPCLTEIGKTLAVKNPSGEYLAQFQISHGAASGTNLGKVKAFELVKSSDGINCLKEIATRDIVSTGSIHVNKHALEAPKEPHYQYILLPFSTNGSNPIILKTYWERNDKATVCKIFNDCLWIWLGSISVNPIGPLGSPGTYKRPIWIQAHRRNNQVRLDASILTTEEFNYAYNPTNGKIGRLSQYTFDYYAGNKELIAANGDGANCVEIDVAPTNGDVNVIKKTDPWYNPQDPKHKFVLNHPPDIAISADFDQTEKSNFMLIKGIGGGIYSKDLPYQKGWGTLPSGTAAFWSRVREWLKGTAKIGDRAINRKLACVIIDLKFRGWPTESTPYNKRGDLLAKDLITYLREQVGWENQLFSRVIMSVPDAQSKNYRSMADTMFPGGYPGLFDGYDFPANYKSGDLVKNRIDFLNTLRQNGVNYMSIGLNPAKSEYLPGLGLPPLEPAYLFTPFLAEMKNQKDRNKDPEGFMFWTVDLIHNITEGLDHGADGIISNWPSRVRILLDQYPYKYYLRRATPEDSLRLPK
ncbi:MAG: hypothetical protein ACHQYQ_03320 [Bacteriovoracales bacterium]